MFFSASIDMGQWTREPNLDFPQLAISLAPPEAGSTAFRGEPAQVEGIPPAASFPGAAEGVVITDPQGRVIAANPAFSRMTGYSSQDICGRGFGLLRSGRHGPEFYREMWSAIRTSGYWRGEIWNRRKCGQVYPALLTIHALRDDQGQTTHYVGASADLSSVDWSAQQSQYLLRHDGLTGLPNRLLLYPHLDEAVARASASGATGAVLIVDLDRFGTINDSLGREAGDALLTSVSERLRGPLRPTDMLARLGGDEFVVVLESAGAAASAETAERLIATLAEPFTLSGGQEVYVGASVGISLFPEHGTASHELIQHADAALHRARGAGEGVYRLYSAELTRTATTRVTLDAKMRRALEREEFELHYQPIVSLAEGTVVGVEALLRWNDRVAGLLPPDHFIPLAEETGVIAPLTDWVLRTACAQMKTWLAEGAPFRFMAVNVSPKSFRGGDFAEKLGAILKETGLPGECLDIELTEGVLLESTVELPGKMAALKALGVGLAIDDFGTGYSSLAYLKQLPIDRLKIDRGFVLDIPDDPKATKITSAIIALAQTLGLDIVAEGVETQRQLEFLLDSGCRLGQGRLLGSPAPACGVAEFLARRRLDGPPRGLGKSAA